jgi:flavorubredoxin
MYGNTETAMNAVVQGVSAEGIEVDIFDAARTHVSYILPSLWENAGVLVGAPTYEGSLFPPVKQAIEMAVEKSIRYKKVGMFGSYGWSGGARKDLQRLVEPLKWEFVDAFEFAGGASKDELKKAEEFGRAFAKAITPQA